MKFRLNFICKIVVFGRKRQRRKRPLVDSSGRIDLCAKVTRSEKEDDLIYKSDHVTFRTSVFSETRRMSSEIVAIDRDRNRLIVPDIDRDQKSNNTYLCMAESERLMSNMIKYLTTILLAIDC